MIFLGLIERVELTMNKETLICPSTFGAQSWNSGAYNPKTGLWYNDVLDFCDYLKPVEQKVDPKDYGTGHTGSNDFGRWVMAPDGRKPGKLSANDPLTGERKWSVDMDVPGAEIHDLADLEFVPNHVFRRQGQPPTFSAARALSIASAS